jgi:TolB-like protein/DNA-binding winged helix-turn-helix (wHTH) protein
MEARTQALRFAGGSFDPLRGELRVGERQARLRPRSAAVLALLLDERGRVVGRDELMRQVWPDAVVTDDSLAQCIKEIRRALGPAAERIRTMPRIGYAFADAAPDAVAEPRAAAEPAVESVSARPAAEPAATTSPTRAAAAPTTTTGLAQPAPEPATATVSSWAANGARTTTGSPRGVMPRWQVGAFASMLVALLVLFALGPSMVPGSRNAPASSVVVLPLANAGGDAGQQAFADGIADDLTTDLSRIPGTFVIARSTADSYRGKPVNARAVGRELGVRYIVEGGVQRAGAQVVLNVRLVDAQADGIVWSERFDAVPDDLDALQRRVTLRIARTLQLVLMEEEAARSKRHPSVGPEEALELFRAQVRENPGYAPAWMWAATAHIQLGDYAAAAADAEQAIRLSPNDTRLPFFYSVLGRARLHAGDAAGALAAAEQAARSPGPNRYAPLLVAAAAMELGDTGRARQVINDFLARNPGYSAVSLRESRLPVGPRNGDAEERYIASLVAAGLPKR